MAAMQLLTKYSGKLMSRRIGGNKVKLKEQKCDHIHMWILDAEELPVLAVLAVSALQLLFGGKTNPGNVQKS